MSKYTVIVSGRTDEMLIRHARFLAQVRVSAARRMASELAKVLDALEQNPYQFPAELDYNLPEGAYRKALFSKWYKAIFSVAGETVYLDAVLDCRQDNTNCQPGKSRKPSSSSDLRIEGYRQAAWSNSRPPALVFVGV